MKSAQLIETPKRLYVIIMSRTRLLLQLKSRSARGASHHSAFMENCWTISHTFYSFIYPVYEGNEV